MPKFTQDAKGIEVNGPGAARGGQPAHAAAREGAQGRHMSLR